MHNSFNTTQSASLANLGKSSFINRNSRTALGRNRISGTVNQSAQSLSNTTLPPVNKNLLQNNNHYFSGNQFLNNQTNMMISYINNNEAISNLTHETAPNETRQSPFQNKLIKKNIEKQKKHIWFGKKYKGGLDGGVLKQKDPYEQPEKPILQKPKLLDFEKYSNISEEGDDEMSPTPGKNAESQKSFEKSSLKEETKEENSSESSDHESVQKLSYKENHTTEFSEGQCNFCLDKKSPLEPISNLCIHKFCHRCIQHIRLTSKNSRMMGGLIRNPEILSVKIKCPYCGILSDSLLPESEFLTKEAVENPDDIDFDTWPKVQDVLTSSNPSVKCEYCPEVGTNNFAQFRCLTCHILICSSCRNHHRVITEKNLKHDMVPFNNPRMSEEKKSCVEHRELRKLFCSNCQEALCLLCAKDPYKHYQHNIVPFKEFVSESSDKQGELRLCALTALSSIKNNLKALQANQDYIQKQREFWEKKLSTMFDNISKIINKKFDEVEKQIDTLFSRVKKFNNVSYLSYGSLKGRLEYYLDLTERTFELDIERANRMIVPTLNDCNDFIQLDQEMFNFSQSKFMNEPLLKIEEIMKDFEFIPSKNKKLKNLKRFLGLIKPRKQVRLGSEDKKSQYAAKYA
ncbi:unnamed protein product [Moneuplotes crassus]|uniref:Uncharacterized protein n=1 Tax=Euplotes crassus TaxID=5936 RepID=A0AAD1X881_EUPCR|nr:unnamed protein product [Moneuplotes crassus]